MEKKINFTEEDLKLNNLVVSKDLSESRIKEYNYVFQEIYEEFGYTPSSLLKKAKEDEKQYIKEGVIEQKSLDDRIVSELQLKYFNYLKNKTHRGKKLANGTIKLKIVSLRTFLNFYKIEVPDMIDIDIDTSRIKENEVPTWDDVETAINFSKSPRDQAMIAFAATTGMRVKDIVNLKVKDLITACKIYFDENEQHTLDNLLKKDPWEIMPCWELNPQKTNKRSKNITIVFNTPETTAYIFKYFEHRKAMNKKNNHGDETINDNEALFKAQGNYGKEGHLTTGTVNDHFRDINNKLGGAKSRNGIYGKFVVKNLRTLFKSTCKEALQYVSVNAEKTVFLNVLDLFLGHKEQSAVAYAYETLPEDSPNSYLRLVYEQLIDVLSIRDTEVKAFKSEEYKKMETKLEEKDKEIEELKQIISKTQEQVTSTNKIVEELTQKRNKSDIKTIIHKHFDTNFRDDINKKGYENGDENIIKKDIVICELATEFALENKKFSGTDEEVDSVIKKAIAKCSFNPEIIQEKYKLIHQQNERKLEDATLISNIKWDIKIIISKHEEIWELVKNDEENLDKTIIDTLVESDYDLNNLTNEELEKISEEIIMNYLS